MENGVVRKDLPMTQNKRKYYMVDCYSDKMKIIWEYEGPDHYENVWKLKRDEEGLLF